MRGVGCPEVQESLGSVIELVGLWYEGELQGVRPSLDELKGDREVPETSWDAMLLVIQVECAGFFLLKLGVKRGTDI